MTGVTLSVTLKAQPGKRDALLSLWEQHLAGRVTGNAGMLSYFVTVSDGDAGEIRIFEHYASAEALQAHAGADYFAEFVGVVSPLLAAPPEMVQGQPFWAKANGEIL